MLSRGIYGQPPASCGTHSVASCYRILSGQGGQIENSWHVVTGPRFHLEFPSPKFSAVFSTRQEMNKLCLYFVLLRHITGLNLPLLSKSKHQVRNATYGLMPHPVKLNNLPQYKARLWPQSSRPGLGLSPPTHCQLGCYSKARKQVTLASHLPHTPT